MEKKEDGLFRRWNPNLTIDITNWIGVLTALKKIDTPSLNSISGDINTPYEIDSASALTNHVRTVIGNNVREILVSSDHRKLPADVLEFRRAKNAALRRASAYPTAEYKSRTRVLPTPNEGSHSGGSK
ncbi:hypothetical protein EVAR_44940_1 [Eumeta japonica]|uniref:Uncharacterized protein n=1 Tax=Eumeta variegata TaxID=151549 RepID=A0A4C1W5D1_EUMVA|nr:hypothetical protein EVAR_44940_1 [Eumeta japonica]